MKVVRLVVAGHSWLVTGDLGLGLGHLLEGVDLAQATLLTLQNLTKVGRQLLTSSIANSDCRFQGFGPLWRLSPRVLD
jgi:hypothetical protein